MAKRSEAFMFTCDLCGGPYQHGPHRYEGKPLRHYKMFVCGTCYQMNWDGIAPAYEKKFEKHLAEHGIPLPERVNGFYPRGS